jgi:lipoprotein-anchoring transpeptidase ErfK/SrfK
MPHSVFFHGGYAIHGTYDVKRLGRPASHGCIRLAPQNAAAFFAMVQRTGNKNTRIVITR